MGNIIGIIAITAQASGLVDKGVDAVMNADANDFGIPTLSDVDIEQMPNMAETKALDDKIDGYANAVDGLDLTTSDYEKIVAEADRAEQMFQDTDASLDRMYDISRAWDANVPKYIEDALNSISFKDLAIIAGIIAGITALAMAIGMGYLAGRYISRVLSKAISRAKFFIKRNVTKIKDLFKRKIARAKANRTKIKQKRDAAAKRKRDFENSVTKKVEAKIRKLDTKTLKDRIQQIIDKWKGDSGGFAKYLAVIFALTQVILTSIKDGFESFVGLGAEFIKVFMQIVEQSKILLNSLIALLKDGYTLTVVMMFLAPLLVIMYYTTYFIQLLQREY